MEFERVVRRPWLAEEYLRDGGYSRGLQVKGWQHGGVIGRMEAVFL